MPGGDGVTTRWNSRYPTDACVITVELCRDEGRGLGNNEGGPIESRLAEAAR